MRAHKGIFITSLVASFVGLVLQVQIPNLLNNAITNSIQTHTVPLSHYVWWIVALGLVGGIAGYISRLFLFETAYDIEFDLRNIIYEHLTKMSFPFYDRVQSGQLISRANSDIRSVQMYMTFAPSILVQCSIAVVAFVYMLSHQRAPGLRGHGHHAVRLPGRREDAEVDVPGVLADPVPTGRRGHHRGREHQRGPGGQVLRRRAAAAPGPVRGGRQGAVELHQGRRPPGPLHPRRPEPPPGGPGPGAPVRRVHGHPRPPEHRSHPGLQRLPAHAAGPVHDARHAHHDGPAGGGLGRPHLRDPRRAAHGHRRPRCHRPRRLPRRRPLRPRGLRLRGRCRTARCWPTSTCTSPRGRRWPWSAAPVPASPRWPGC